MKITKLQLKQLIKEEIETVLNERKKPWYAPYNNPYERYKAMWRPGLRKEPSSGAWSGWAQMEHKGGAASEKEGDINSAVIHLKKAVKYGQKAVEARKQSKYRGGSNEAVVLLRLYKEHLHRLEQEQMAGGRPN
jgi:hypothetical protein